MTEIANFYGFTVAMDSDFQGSPNIVIDYEADHLQGHYDLIEERFIDSEFPQSLLRVLQEWLSDNIQALRTMWTEKTLTPLPDWE